MPGKCSFQERWFSLDCGAEWKQWLRPVSSDKYKAYCLLCKCQFDVGCSGVGSVKKHEKGKKHSSFCTEIVSGRQSVLNFQCDFTVSSEQNENTVLCTAPVSSNDRKLSSTIDLPTVTPEISGGHKPSSSTSLGNFLIKDEVTKAEILWAINKVVTHSSDRGSSNASDLFPIMFPDSMIASKFQMQKDKLAYVVTYGLGPYFQSALVEDVKKCTYYAVSFDESLNKISQKGQMDIVVRYWNIMEDSVSTRYLTSAFMLHSTASDILQSFTSTLVNLGLPLGKIIQISMDGPNVNLKFARDIREHLKKDAEDIDQREIFDTGTCSLHIVNGAYKTAHKTVDWKIHEFLRALYYLFKDYPSRRADYIRYSGSSKFPKKFCTIRWVENSGVIKRALEIVLPLKKYVEAAQSKPPATKNFDKVRNALRDTLLQAKLEFLLTIAEELESFLVSFQSNKPLLPFLYKEMYIVLRSLADRFICKEVMDKVQNPRQLLAIDLSDSKNLKMSKGIDVGFGASLAVKSLNELQVLCFRDECKKFLVTLFRKLTQKCPLNYKTVRGASCLSPEVMCSETLRTSRVVAALEEFVCKKYLTPLSADSIKRDYLRLCGTVSVQETLKTFKQNEMKLDDFLMNIIKEERVTNKDLIKFFHLILTMFHGNADVERGFSINKQCLVENMLEESLVAQRSVYGAVGPACNLSTLIVSKAMIHAARNSSSKRKEALKKKRELQDEKQNEQVKIANDLKNLEGRKRRLMFEKKEAIETIDSEIMALKRKLKCIE